MSFFNYTPDPSSTGWSVSSDFWMYWVCAVPLTCLTLAVWHWRQRMGGALVGTSIARPAETEVNSRSEKLP